jgi:CRP/FNR family cyclic AMP-dependent transcriptional regulator
MRCAAVEEHPFFGDVPAEKVRALAAESVEFAPGTFIFRDGHDAHALYLLCAGRVALELNVPTRGPIQLEDLRAGDILGLSWLFPPYRWHLDARAVEPVRAFAIDGAVLRDRMRDDAALGNVLATRLLRYTYDRLERVRLQRLDLYRTDP